MDSSKAWTTTTTTSNSTFPSSRGTLASPLSQFGGTIEPFVNPSWSTVRTLPPPRRFSEAQIPSPWMSSTSQFAPPVAIPPPADAVFSLQSQVPLSQEQSPCKRRRIERFGEAQHPPSSPEADAESLSTLHAQHRQSALSALIKTSLGDLAFSLGMLKHNVVGRAAKILHDSLEIGTPEALEWAIQRLRWNNASLRTLVSVQAGGVPEPPPLFCRTPSPPSEGPIAGLKRPYDGSENPIESSSRRSTHRSGGPSSLTSSHPDDNWRALESMDPPNHPSHQHRRLSSFSYIPPFASPTQTSQAARTLPSPSSLNLHIPSSLGSAPASGPSSAQTAHLQDLQHQVSVKTLALQTLQKEYDSLLQKLERQRVRSGALEKKFEVSDAEINSLTDEREKLMDQVQFLENQVEELQRTRDETRRVGTESASQYMKIVEMADRLQSRSIEDKKAWDKERQLLLGRLHDFEREGARLVDGAGEVGAKHILTGDASEVDVSGNESSKLQWEVRRLTERVTTLETSLQKAKKESHAIREAALHLAGCGQRIDAAIDAGLAQQEVRV
ncbi:hypothetical protein FKW77_005666 [Venturia effusa]|uniref:Uncharacterized protein n=1 Tax=Venturia effusa TaxID=50376 RepID=A0A517L5E2_9PEZI|nr:hypothetical protein FKW77_005666 [Venturia effusa]